LNNENVITLWQNYSRAWMEAYNEFIKAYMGTTENWVRIDKIPMLNSAFGIAGFVNGVDVAGANITGEKQITVTLRYTGKGKAPSISLDAIAIRFDDIHSKLTGSSKLESDWSSPCAKIIELSGNATLNDVKVIGIKVVAL
jgi:hypothetical protein